MQYVINSESNSNAEVSKKLLDLVEAPDFLGNVTIDRYTYEFPYDIKSNSSISDTYCVDAISEEVFQLLSMVDKTSEESFSKSVNVLQELNYKIGGKIYPSILIWKNQELPALLDIAYALSLYNEKYCQLFGDFLTSTDPDHDVYQVDCVNSLLDKYGITPPTIYLLGSYALHGSFANDNIREIVGNSDFSTDLKRVDNQKLLINRLKQIDSLAKGKYKSRVQDIETLFKR